MQEILTHLENGVLTLTLNRPSVFNSFNRSMALQLQAELDRCSTDDHMILGIPLLPHFSERGGSADMQAQGNRTHALPAAAAPSKGLHPAGMSAS